MIPDSLREFCGAAVESGPRRLALNPTHNAIRGTVSVGQNRLQVFWTASVQPFDSLRGKATEFVKRYDLRAGDSLQLAAALEWREQVPQGQVFLTAIRKLREAALLSGFDTKQI